MISFLTCDAKAILRLIIELSYQDKDKIAKQTFEVDNATDKQFIKKRKKMVLKLNG